MRAKLKSSFNYFIAILLICAGILGTVLPILPGVLPILIGLVILSIEIPVIDEWLESKFSKNEKFNKHFQSTKRKVRDIFG